MDNGRKWYVFFFKKINSGKILFLEEIGFDLYYKKIKYTFYYALQL